MLPAKSTLGLTHSTHSLTLQLEPDAAPALYARQPQHLFITPALRFVQELWNLWVELRMDYEGWRETALLLLLLHG